MSKAKAIHELKNELCAVLARVASTGEEVKITKHGKVIARLVPPESSGVVFGLGAGAGVASPSIEDLQWSDDELAIFYDDPIEPE